MLIEGRRRKRGETLGAVVTTERKKWGETLEAVVTTEKTIWKKWFLELPRPKAGS